MSCTPSLLDFILNLLKDPQTQAEFRASPEQVLAANGLTGVSAADIRETLPLVTDNRFVGLNSSHGVPPSVVPPAGDSGVHAAIKYLHHITRTYRYDDHGHYGHDAGHVNIWATGDVPHHFDDSHAVPGDPGAPGSGGGPGTGNWGGDDHESSDHERNHSHGDHTNGLTYGDTQNDPAGSWSRGEAPWDPGHDQDGGLRHYGSGAATSPAGGPGSPAAYPGDTFGSHDSTGFHPLDSGGTASPWGPDDSYPHDAHGSFGDSYYGQQDSYYGLDTGHCTHDNQEPHIYLELH